MQALLSLPGLRELEGKEGIAQSLFRKVCGVPLLVRVIATASRSGATSVLILHPKNIPEAWLRARLNSPLFSSIPIQMLALDDPFDPNSPLDWQAVESRLEPRFLWLPWNYVADKQALKQLVERSQGSSAGVRFLQLVEGSPEPETPAVVVTAQMKIEGGLRPYLANSTLELVPASQAAGWPVSSPETARHTERELVRRSGKAWDGIHSRFNRWLCRPFVRWLSKTPVTPNMVTLAGLPIAFLSGYWFAQGYWSAYVAGALLYFVAVLFDEIDGMLARSTFRESAFGCWLESFVDYASYIPVFAGMAIGLYRQHGSPWLGMGGLLLFGTVTTFFVAVRHRKLATPDRPSEYLNRYYHLLEADSGNVMSRFVRRVHFFIKKGVLCHYVLIFSVLGALNVFFAMASVGSNLAWILGLYTIRLFRSSPSGQAAEWKHPASLSAQ